MQATTFSTPLKKALSTNTLVGLHVIIGIILAFLPSQALVYLLCFFFYSLLRIIQTGNKNNEAAFVAVYLASFEILLRQSDNDFIYEFGKYSVSLILFTGMSLEKTPRKLPVIAIIYFCLLIPAIFVGNYSSVLYFRRSVSFNFSGPLSLMMSWLYFCDRKFNKAEFQRLMTQIILPIIGACALILVRIPSNFDFSQLTISTKAFSGGFGPNQVSAVLGFGFFVVFLMILFNQKIFENRIIDIILAFSFLTFGILTFSRGGVLTGVISLIVSVFIYISLGRGSRQFSKLFIGVVAFGVISYFMWNLLNKYTGDSISRRYESTITKKSSGAGQSGNYADRSLIMKDDLEAFMNSPLLGNGPEGSAEFRRNKYHHNSTAHTEYTRLLGDHGLLGVGVLIILFSSFLRYYRNRKGDNKIILGGFMSISLLTMLHAAMRLAIPGLAFGLALIDVNLEDHSLERRE